MAVHMSNAATCGAASCGEGRSRRVGSGTRITRTGWIRVEEQAMAVLDSPPLMGLLHPLEHLGTTRKTARGLHLALVPPPPSRCATVHTMYQPFKSIARDFYEAP